MTALVGRLPAEAACEELVALATDGDRYQRAELRSKLVSADHTDAVKAAVKALLEAPSPRCALLGVQVIEDRTAKFGCAMLVDRIMATQGDARARAVKALEVLADAHPRLAVRWCVNAIERAVVAAYAGLVDTDGVDILSHIAARRLDETTRETLWSKVSDYDDREETVAAAFVLRAANLREAICWAEHNAENVDNDAREAAATLLAGASGATVVRALRGLCADWQSRVGIAAVRSLVRIDSGAGAWLVSKVSARDSDLRLAVAVGLMLAPSGVSADSAAAAFLQLAGDESAEVSEAALSAMAQLPRPVVRQAIRRRGRTDQRARAGALRALAVIGTTRDRPTVQRVLARGDCDERPDALRALCRCDPQEALRHVDEMLGHDDETVCKCALELLVKLDPSRASVEALKLSNHADSDRQSTGLAMLLHDEGPRAAARLLLSLCVNHDERRDDLTRMLLNEASHFGRRLRAAGVTDVAAIETDGVPAGALQSLLRDEATRSALYAGLDGLRERVGWSDRTRIATTWGRIGRQEAGDRLIDMCTDGDEDVRVAALTGLAESNHPGVVRQVMLGLLDADAKVSSAAALLLQTASSGRLVEHVRTAEANLAESLLLRVDELKQWTKHMARRLLGDAVRLEATRRGAGHTQWARRGDGIVEVSVNFAPMVDAGEQGDDVVKGVILHEFGHHMFDYRQPGFKSANGAAAAQGAGMVFDLLIDERLERLMRSYDPACGELIDRANAWLRQAHPIDMALADYAKAVAIDVAELRDRLAAETLPGVLVERGGQDPKVEIASWDAARIEGLLPPLHAFLVGLLVVRNPSRIADPLARAALAMVPADLKEMNHAEIAALAYAISSKLGCLGSRRKQRLQHEALRERLGQLLAGIERLLSRLRDSSGDPFDTGSCHDADGSRIPGSRSGTGTGPVATFPHLGTRGPIVSSRRPRSADLALGGKGLNLGAELDFPRLELTETVPLGSHNAPPLEVDRRLVRQLRRHFERIGLRLVDETGRTSGHRIDIVGARRLAVVPNPGVLIRAREEQGADAYVGLLIDRSGSMDGDKLFRARCFAALLAEAARGIRGISGHINAFDDDTFYRLGTLERHAIAGLTCGGGNNDAGGLERAAELALASRHRHRLIVMLSDGSPTECTVEALRALVKTLERDRGIALAQVKVDEVEHDAFPRSVDLSEDDAPTAARRFARLLAELTSRWGAGTS